MDLTGFINIVWALLLLNSGLFRPVVVFGDTFPRSFRQNETVSLTVKLPTRTEPTYGKSKGLLWQDLSVVTSNHEYLLHPSSGFVENGHVCGILGPSGAGKTTFLSSIAGRPEATLHVEGKILHYELEGTDQDLTVKCAPTRTGSVAWLHQHDAFFERLSVRETLDLAVFLELPHLTLSQRDEVAQSCLDSLGLSGLQNRPVGSAKSSRVSNGVSLSGGELRRLSVALELVTMPNLFLADEPTSGIDSKMSENVMTAIASLARERDIPCLCTLHQPRSSIWHMLDSVILMAPGGWICYTGSRKNVLGYFSSLGYMCPGQTNPAEFLIDLVSIDPEDNLQAERDVERIKKLAYAFSQHTKEQSKTRLTAEKECSVSNSIPFVNATEIAASRHPLRLVRRFGALFLRSLRQNLRSTGLNVFRLAISTGTALLLSQIFPSITKGEPHRKSVADRVALLSFGVINMMMTAVMKTMDVFSREQPVIQRERRRKLYSCLEYLVSKSMAEIPMDAAFAVFFTTTLKATTGLSISWKDITVTFSMMTLAGATLGFLIGSVTPSQEAAISTGIPILIIMMIVGVINPSGVDPTAKKPALIEWVKSISPIASAIEALAVAEFTGMQFETTKSFLGWRRLREVSQVGGVALVKNGEEVLDALGLRNVKYGDVMKHMAVLSLVNFGLCYFFLRSSDRRWIGRIKKRLRAMVTKERRHDGVQQDRLDLEDIEARSRNMERSNERKPLQVAFRARP